MSIEIPQHLQPFLVRLTKMLQETLSDDLVGIYLHGSLSYGGYVKARSDIDVLILLRSELTREMCEKLDVLFAELSQTHPEEVKNTELDILHLEEVAREPLILHSLYTFMDNEPKGPEVLDGFWIELENVRESGVVLYGPEPKIVIPSIDRQVLTDANRQKFSDLQKNAGAWEQIDVWNQTYLIVQASRVLYSLNNNLEVTSKQNALSWALKNTPGQFTEMLAIAKDKLDDFDGPREQIISDAWKAYFDYVESQLLR